MGRIAPIALLLVLGACSSSRDATNPPTTPTPAHATAPPVPQPPASPGGSSIQEVNDLFRWLAVQPAAGTTASRASGAGTAAQPAVIYTIPRADPAMLAIVDREAQHAAYQENLEGCLDGRFPAFCDYGALTAYDAAQVQAAEYEANLTTCIDPEWQHLCRPYPLPETPGAIAAGRSEPARPVPALRVAPSSVPAASPAATPDLVAPAVPSPSYVTASPSPPAGMIAAARPGRFAAPPALSAPAAHLTPTFPAPPPAITAPPVVVQDAGAQAATQPAAFHVPRPAWQPMPSPPIRYAPACSESGSCYGDISAKTGLSKTTYVHGYFRRNGTYVRGYYRSR